MSYFNLRKHQPEPEPEPIEEEQQEKTEAEQEGAPPTAARGPIVTGLLGPGAWIAAHFGTSTAWGVHAVAVWAVAYYGGWVAAGVIVVWLAAVLFFIPREHLDQLTLRIEGRAEGTPAEVVEEPTAEVFVDPLPGILWELIGDAPGVHLKAVVTHLHKSGLDTACDNAAVRAALARRGITVKGSVRDAVGRVNEGVHRADLQAWEEARSPTTPADTPGARSGPVATALTSDVAEPATAVATPLPRLRRLLSRGAR